MRILVCIDDTDNLDSLGTGELASILAQDIEEKGWGKSGAVTRHQLYVHPDIPYTSHNSSMCFATDLNDEYLNPFLQHAADFLTRKSAEGSDPGLCVLLPEQLKGKDKLIAFGLKAKKEIITKEEAYNLAQDLHIHLSEHGGTGQGVIGALAGIALRLYGNDGRFKGKFKIKSEKGIASVRDILAQSRIEIVKSIDGTVLAEDELVWLGDTVKAVLLEGRCVLLVTPIEVSQAEGIHWQTCSKQLLKNY
ncbi:hypothetical protein ACHOLT_05140 [Desulfitobacterium sp. Sab5]|uniref:hypothetical protein n=1 Tax=Desulfitobacterium nosdiversum TaxID=3375356 RepID=UPI003CEA5EF1